MRDDRSPVAEEEGRVDSGILAMLTAPDASRPWSVDEVAREVGDRIDTDDGLARLYGAGLIHRYGEFVFASRAALAAAQLDFG